MTRVRRSCAGGPGKDLCAAVLCLLAAGCPPGFGDFRVVDGPGGVADAGPRRDGAAGGRDAGPTGGACPGPQLLMAVEDLSNDGDDHGFVARLALAERLPFTRCGDLRGGGQLFAQPFAVTEVEGTVLVASRDGVQAVEAATDRVLWTEPLDGAPHPNDAFPLLDPTGGQLRPAVAFSNWPRSGRDVRTIVVYGETGDRLRQWDVTTPGDLLLGLGVMSVTQSPLRPERLLVLKPASYAAAEADPWAGTIEQDPAYVRASAGTNLRTGAAVNRGTQRRVVWTGTVEGQEGVVYLNETDGAAGQVAGGRRYCRAEPGARACAFTHAVPHPLSTHAFLALCDESGVIPRDLVLFDSITERCEVVLEGPALGPATRLSYLALGLPR